MTDGGPTSLRTLRLTIAYDGTNYAGWQFQQGRATVQEMLEKAIQRVTGRHARTLASGRTDAGVHAWGQVAALRTDSTLPPEVLRDALNANLPPDIAVLEVAEAPDGFRPTYDAVRKRYRYLIHDGPVRDVFARHFAWHYRHGRLDAEAMQRAATTLLGTHDFRSFQSSGAERRNSVRTIFDISVRRASQPADVGCVKRTTNTEVGPAEETGRPHSEQVPQPDQRGRAGGQSFIAIEVEADGFLYNMVRAIVGTLVEVGRGKRLENWPGEVLRAKDRRLAGPTAPPQGLCLVKVEYEEKEKRGQGGIRNERLGIGD